MAGVPDGLPESYFDPQTVVSLDPSGRPLSRYADRSWNLSSMSTDGGQTTCNVYFFDSHPLSLPLANGRAGLAATLREQQKALLWLHMDAGQQRSQKTVSMTSLTLTKLARNAYGRGLTLFELLCDPQALGEVAAGLNNSYSKMARSVVRTLWRHREFLKVQAEVRLKELGETVKQSAPLRGEAGNQTPIMPSSVYCTVLAGLLSSLDQIERDMGGLLDAFRQERDLSLNAPKGETAKQLQYRRTTQLRSVHESMRARGWKDGSLREFIAGEVAGMQLTLMNLVIAFTGMRVGEAQILPLKGVLETVEHRGAVHHVVHGFSHKLNGGRKKSASWVTSREGQRAIVLAQRISSTILDVLAKPGGPGADNALLFCTTSNPFKKTPATMLYKRLNNVLIPALCPLITQADIDELNAMELDRSWLREGIEVGKPWPLTFHQYRRSLSVYAHRSGMVSLPALKGQLQHITDEMRAYYSDGFCRAVNLVFDKEHFSHEWSAAKSESSFLAYSMALLFSDEDLIGNVGGRGAIRMEQVVASRSKTETLQLFRDGKLAYRETVLGGCTAVEACDQTPLNPIPWDCLERDCPNMVVFDKRLSLLIKTQETVVQTLSQAEPGSVEHRLEADHLRVLLKARQRLTEAP